MLLKEVLLQAVSSLVTHRFRAALTMLGIAWGIVTVVLLMAYGNGFHGALLHGFRNAFSDGTAVVWNGQTSMQAGGERAGRPVRMKEDDVEAVRELGSVRHVSPEYIRTLPIQNGSRQTTAGVRGVAPEYAVMRSQTVESGRFVNDEDVERRRRVAFLGYDVARKLFGNSPAVGQTVRIQGLPFEVVGVMTNKAQLSSYFWPDKMSVFIPYSAVRQVWSQEFLSTMVYQAVDPSKALLAKRQVTGVLAARHRFDPRDERAVRFHESREMMQVVDGITGGLKMVLIFIGVLTLMIGGVGVMNIMLVSVTERTREIGLRKALGARRRQILTQFLLEALAITFLGGLAGVALSYGLVTAIGTRPFLANVLDDPTKLTDIQLALSPDVLLTAVMILGFAGILSGVWPAVRASRMDPIESLRYE
jgi:putative ABC transport system permease protein